MAFLFLEGAFILASHGTGHVVVLVFLWVFSYPVIHYGVCRKCRYYGLRCPVPGEGNLVHHFFERSHEDPGAAGYFMGGVCYLMRLGYPAYFLIFYESPWLLRAVYPLTVLAFIVVLGRIIGCPNCLKEECPMNPSHSTCSAGEN